MPAEIRTDGLKAEADLAKQIIALATGAVAFTITFLDNFSHKDSAGALSVPAGLYAAWVLFGITILFATWHLMAITGSLTAIDRKLNGWPLSPAQQLSADGDMGNTVIPGYGMILSFLLAVAAMIWVGFSL